MNGYLQMQFLTNYVPVENCEDDESFNRLSDYLHKFIGDEFGYDLNNLTVTPGKMSFLVNFLINDHDDIKKIINTCKENIKHYKYIYIIYFWRGSIHRKVYKNGVWSEDEEVKMYYWSEISRMIDFNVRDPSERATLKFQIKKLYHADMDTTGILIEMLGDHCWAKPFQEKDKKEK